MSNPLQVVARSVWRGSRRMLEWLLYPGRHRRSLKASRRRVPAMIMFVCHGNICRSPYAEHAVRRLLPAALQKSVCVQSAGFFGPDRPAPDEALESARLRGVEMSQHRSRLITTEMIVASDLVFVMEEAQRSRLLASFGRPRGNIVVLGDCDPSRREPRTIADPYGKSLSAFNQTYDRIDRCLQQVIEIIGAAVRNGSP